MSWTDLFKRDKPTLFLYDADATDLIHFKNHCQRYFNVKTVLIVPKQYARLDMGEGKFHPAALTPLREKAQEPSEKARLADIARNEKNGIDYVIYDKESAENLLIEHQPQCILVDNKMPGTEIDNGATLLTWARDLERAGKIQRAAMVQHTSGQRGGSHGTMAANIQEAAHTHASVAKYAPNGAMGPAHKVLTEARTAIDHEEKAKREAQAKKDQRRAARQGGGRGY